jgi:hypothetical protein
MALAPGITAAVQAVAVGTITRAKPWLNSHENTWRYNMTPTTLAVFLAVIVIFVALSWVRHFSRMRDLERERGNRWANNLISQMDDALEKSGKM